MADYENESSATRALWLAGLGIGALIMYLADPQSGRGRRARLKDRYRHTARLVQHGADAVLRDAQQRAGGTVAAVRGYLNERNGAVDDAILQERVRAALGRATSHPGAIEVQVAGDAVTLHGDALRDEVGRIVEHARKARGVQTVECRVRLHDSPENFPTLRGRGARSGARPALMQENWSPAWRSLAGAIGAGLTVAGWLRGGVHGLALGTTGAGVLARAVTNRDLKTLVGAGDASRGDGVVVQKAIHIEAPVEQVYDMWSVENFPGWMSHVREVRAVGANRHHWVVDGPAGMPAEWDAEIVNAVPNREIEWRTVPGSRVDMAGHVRFTSQAEGTRVQVTLCYVPPGGVIGHVVAKALGGDPKTRMDDDLMRFKALVETGNAPHDAGAHRGRTQRRWPFSGVRH